VSLSVLGGLLIITARISAVPFDPTTTLLPLPIAALKLKVLLQSLSGNIQKHLRKSAAQSAAFGMGCQN
jgi:hypothetical protein